MYGRGLLTPPRRYVITIAMTLWGASAGAMSASPACIQRAAQNPDPASVLRRELSRIAVQHNPNRALESAARDKMAHEHGVQLQPTSERQQQSVLADGQRPG